MHDQKTIENNKVTVEFTGIIVYGLSARELVIHAMADQMSYLANIGIGSELIKENKNE